MNRPAVFFDRDNTLIAADGYLGNPAEVKLIDGAADAVARARRLGFAAVIFSNQSGVARGLFTEEAVRAVNERLDELLQDQNSAAVIDRHEFCPFHPQGTVERYRQESDLRKPKPGMILQAASRLGLDLSNSWAIGDAPRNIEAGAAAGCRTILIVNPALAASPASREPSKVPPDFTSASLGEAIDFIEKALLTPPETDLQSAEPAAPEASAPAAAGASPAPPQAAVAPPAPAAAAPLDGPITAPPAPGGIPSPMPAASPPAAPSQSNMRPSNVMLSAAPTAPAAPVQATPAAPALALPARRPTPASFAPQPSVQPPAPIAPPPPNLARLESLSEQILDQLRRNHEQPRDFSLSHLGAGMVQIITLGALVMAYLERQKPAMLTPLLLIALILQTMTIALLIMGRQR